MLKLVRRTQSLRGRLSALLLIAAGVVSSPLAFAQSTADNTATVTAPSTVTDSVSTNNSSSVSNPVLVPMMVTKQITGGPAGGAPGTYQFTIACTGNSQSYSGSITLAASTTSNTTTVNIPRGMTGCTITENIGTRPPPPTNYTWGTPTYTQPVSPIANGSTARIVNPLTILPNVAVRKTASANPLLRGVSGQYYDITLTITDGPTTAAITLTDTLPTGITLSGAPTRQASSTSTTGGALSGCPATGSNLTGCTIATGATNGTIVIRVPITVGATATTGNNTATVTGGGDPDCTGTTCAGSVTVPVGNPPNVAVSSPTVAEGGNEVFAVTLSNPSGTAVTFTPTFAAGTTNPATVGADTGTPVEYSTDAGATWTTWTTGDITIPAGVTSVLVRVPTTDDSIDEADETFTLAAAVTSGNTSNTSATGTGTITDNDTAPTLSINDVTVAESVGNATVRVSLSAVSGQSVTVVLNTANDTAVAPGDYTAQSAVTVTIPAGALFADVLIPIIDDTLSESNESFNVVLSSPTNATINDATGVVTITDNDLTSASISLSPTLIDEDGLVNLVYTVTITTPSSTDTVVNLLTTGTATDGTDYTGAVTSVTILAGQTTATVTIDPVTDAVVELNETVILTVGAGTGYTVGTSSVATGTISNDDSLTASIAVAPASVDENGTTNLVYTVTLNTPSSTDTVVNLLTTGTATDGTDYTGALTSVTILAGQTTATVTIDPATDAVMEPNETVILTVGAGTGYTLGTPLVATGTITEPTLPIIANVDTGTAPSTGGVAVPNVLVNDTLNGAPVTLAQVNLTQVSASNPGITLDPATGAVTVAAGLPAGTYTLTYQICEKLNPTNCDTAVVTMTVAAGNIDAVEDTGSVSSTGGVAVPNVLVNDTLNGAPVTLAQINLTQVASSNPGITLNPTTGAITVVAGLPAGTYTLTYQICEQLNPTNCDTAVVTVTVGNGEIIANEDAGSVPTTGGVAVPNVLVNDTLNGAAVTLPQVILTVISEASEAGVVLNPATGQVTVAPGTPAGTYQLAYQICERVNPTNCDPAKVTVSVAAGSIIANEDSSTAPSTGGVAVPNVLINDTLNGAPVTLSQINLTQSASSNPGITLDPVSGAVNVAPSLPAGTYTLTYQICEKLNPDNCDTAAVTVSIDPPLANASVSGTAFYDMDGDRMASPRDQRMSGFIVELLRIENGAERVVGTARTDSEGRYVIANQVPGTGYMIRFRDPVGNVIVGSPFNQAASTQAGNPSTGTNALMQPVAPNVVTPVSGVIANITLYGTDNTIAQNLPLDPNGVIYDSVTRQPLAGATVRIVGPAGFDPARHVVGGSDTFVTGALGYYQFLFINSPPNGTYRFVVTPPSGYTPGQAVAGGVAPAQGVYQVTAGRHEIQPNRTPPAVGVNGLPGTVYHYEAAFNFSGAPGEIVNNHIPFDPIGAATGTMRVTKSAQQRSIKLGDLVRYTLIVENTGTVPVVDGALIDTPPAGFTYVDGSLTVGDRDGAGRLVGSNPLSVDQIDIAVGERATLTYLMRVGAGVRPGTYTNRAQMRDDGQGASNVATADVQVVGDPMTDVSTILGTVFDDRNGDGSQQEGEAGIPGVRIVSVEGLVIETDQFGRYHLAGLPISNSERGSNVILKVDPATLPAGTRFTTDNPLVRRVTQGLPIRFDFGVQLSAGEASGSAQEIEMKLGEVFFAPGSAQMSDGYRSAIDQMAAGVREHGAGEVVIEADGESEALALERALEVQRALEGVLKPAELANVRISVQTKSSPGQMVAGLQQTPLLGVVLFDTDRATIKPEYRALIQQMAKLIEETRATRIVITGHADRRGDEQYNLELGQRRAAAVTEAIASQLSPELRSKLRVETERLPVAGGK